VKRRLRQRLHLISVIWEQRKARRGAMRMGGRGRRADTQLGSRSRAPRGRGRGARVAPPRGRPLPRRRGRRSSSRGGGSWRAPRPTQQRSLLSTNSLWRAFRRAIGAIGADGAGGGGPRVQLWGILEPRATWTLGRPNSASSCHGERRWDARRSVPKSELRSCSGARATTASGYPLALLSRQTRSEPRPDSRPRAARAPSPRVGGLRRGPGADASGGCWRRPRRRRR
jgi:hypothetical protein